MTFGVDSPVTEDCRIAFLGWRSRTDSHLEKCCFSLIRAAWKFCLDVRLSLSTPSPTNLYGEIHYQRPLVAKDLEAVEARIEIASQDEPFEKLVLPKEEAMELFAKDGHLIKVNLLKFRQSDTVKVYRCRWLHDYFYGYMVPPTGYLTQFRLHYYLPFILQVPDPDNPDQFHLTASSLNWPVSTERRNPGPKSGSWDGSGAQRIIAGKERELIRIAGALHEKDCPNCRHDL